MVWDSNIIFTDWSHGTYGWTNQIPSLTNHILVWNNWTLENKYDDYSGLEHSETHT